MRAATNQLAPRILITRLSAIGDCLQSMPLACALRDRLPQAHIAWAVEKAAAPLVAACTAVDETIVIGKRMHRTPSILWQTAKMLREKRFDVTIDPQSLMKSAVLARLTNTRQRIGFARPQGREIAPWLNSERIACRALHMVDRNLELIRPLGIERPEVRFGLRIPAAAESFAERLLAERPQLRGGFAAINPGAGWDSKRWPLERYAEVARHLAKRGLQTLVVWGIGREKVWAEEIVAAAKDAAILAPPTTLLELAAVLNRARLFVGSDTGPLHLAVAVGTPSVSMFGPSQAEVAGPYGANHIKLQVAFDNSRGRKRSGADNWAMREIGAAAVCDACDRQLDATRESAA
jgi:lipopolysaccharide heptosyltransferase I